MLRTNVDYCFVLREPYISNRKRIFDNFGSAFPSFEFFCQVMDQCTQNYECIVINNNSQSNRFQDNIFWYKAQMHGEFRIGAPEFWQHAANNTREGEAKEGDYNAAMRRKGPTIQVRKFPQQ
jgi:hypothetical protein